MNMERNEKCENFILDLLRKGRCRIDAFYGAVFDKQTVDASLNELLHSEKVSWLGGSLYALNLSAPKMLRNRLGKSRNGPRPDPPKDTGKKKKKGRGKSRQKMRAERYTGDLTDKSSAERF